MEVSPTHYLFGADDVQAGEAFHMNYAIAFEVIPNWLRVGINGYYLKQRTDTEVDGHEIPNTRERVHGIGPGAVLHIFKDNHLFVNYYEESRAENRTEGKRLIIRFVHHF